MASQVLPVDEHIRALLSGDADTQPCDEGELEQLDLQVPSWFDEHKFKRGQEYIRRNMMGAFGVALSGLLCVLAVPSILKILIKTQKSSTVEGAYRRYLSTSKHVYSWYFEDIRPGTTTWKSLTTVRMRHLKNSKISQVRGDGIISQRDLVLTQFGFFSLALLKPQIIGMEHDNPEDLEAYTHFWRTIGYMIGIQDRYNLCRPSLEETKLVSQVICDKVYKNFLQNPPEYFFHMVVDLLDGMWYLDTSLNTKAFIYYTYHLVGVPGFTVSKADPKIPYITTGQIFKEITENCDNSTKDCDNLYKDVFNSVKSCKDLNKNGGIKTLNDDDKTNGLFKHENLSEDNKLNPDKLIASFDWAAKFTLFLIFCVYKSWLFTEFGRWYYNMRTRIVMWFACYLPFIAFWRFGIKRSYVNMFVDDIILPGTLRTNKEMLDKLYT